MKLSQLLMVVLLLNYLNVGLIAQPILTDANSNPQPTEVFLTQSVNPNSFAKGDSGANVTWDFSTLSSVASIGFTYYAKSDMPTPGDYPLSTVGAIDDNNAELYYIADTDSQAIEGFVLGSSFGIYTDPWKFLQFPFTLGDTMNDTFDGTVYNGFSQQTFFRKGDIQVISDGYGTVSLPYGDLDDVLRVKSFISYSDSLPGFGIVSVYSEVRYQWYLPGLNSPLVSYINLTSTPFGGASTDLGTFIYMDESSAVKIDPWAENLQLKLYPNPSQGSVQLSLNLIKPEEMSLSLFDTQGRLVFEQNELLFHSGENKLNMDFPQLSPGLYLFLVQTDGHKAWKKLTIE